MKLTESQIERYNNHLILKDIKGDGQRRLLEAKVLIIGAGGLGSPAAYYLAAAGVGSLIICDGDKIELSNLQRQILYSTSDIGRPKAVAAKERIEALNPDVKVTAMETRFNEENAGSLVGKADLVLDCCDHFPTKYLIADTCLELKKPYSYAGVVGLKGMTMTVVPGSPCLRCVFPTPPEECVSANCRGMGILGATAGLFGSIQAAEAVKYIAKAGELLTGRLFTLDLLSFSSRTLTVEKDKNCSCS